MNFILFIVYFLFKFDKKCLFKQWAKAKVLILVKYLMFVGWQRFDQITVMIGQFVMKHPSIQSINPVVENTYRNF